MALTIKTIFKIYLLFFAFVACGNIFIETMNILDLDMSTENQDYLNYLTIKLNGEFDTESTGNTLLTNFKGSIATQNLFNEGIINSFFGVLKVIGQVILFIAELALNLLFTPGVITQILLYNFLASSQFLNLGLGIIVNVFFYMTMFHIIFKRRVTQ